MPCYEPPPPWEGAQKQNAEQAAKLLCGKVTALLDSGHMVERELLLWYAEHRQIDWQIATTPYYGKPDKAEAARAVQDIERARVLLGA